jgi:hypothetical protein
MSAPPGPEVPAEAGTEAAAPAEETCPPKVEDQVEVDRLYQEVKAAVTELNCEKANDFEQQWRTYNAFFAVSDEDRLSKAQEFMKYTEEVFGADFSKSATLKLVPLVADAGR